MEKFELNTDYLNKKRLGVPLGEHVKMEHLLKYGRTDIDFYKIDDENYYMDFSV
jgi:hypothetical protein